MKKSTRQRYDSVIPYFYSIGREELIPESLRKTIPAATKSKWRKMPPHRFSHGAYRYQLDQLADKRELQLRLDNHRAMLYGVSRAFVSLRSIFHLALKQNQNDFAQKALLVRSIRSNEQFVPVKNALRYLDIPPSTFYEWESDVKHRCDHSPVTKCVRRRPHQVTKKELRIMKRLLTAKRFEYWPITSICYHASRQNILHLSLNTWYKYCKILCVKRKVYRKAPKTKGIQAKAANEIWHMDVTFFSTVDGKTYAIYEVVDNFSRMILSWNISDRLSMHHTREVLIDAVKMSNGWHEPMDIALIVDGGRENFNKEVNEFLKQNTLIERLNARKDITFSNSRIEAVHRILKSRYLRSKPLPALKQLKRALVRAIRDYNEIRPHGSLKGLTPWEVYTKENPDFKFSEQRVSATKKRCAQHRAVECHCTGFGRCPVRKGLPIIKTVFRKI